MTSQVSTVKLPPTTTSSFIPNKWIWLQTLLTYLFTYLFILTSYPVINPGIGVFQSRNPGIVSNRNILMAMLLVDSPFLVLTQTITIATVFVFSNFDVVGPIFDDVDILSSLSSTIARDLYFSVFSYLMYRISLSSVLTRSIKRPCFWHQLLSVHQCLTKMNEVRISWSKYLATSVRHLWALHLASRKFMMPGI